MRSTSSTCSRPLARTQVLTSAGRAQPVTTCSAVSRPQRQQSAKQALRDAILTTNRGGSASSSERGSVLEAQVGLESLSQGSIDYELLPGLWRLIYTTAPDVRPLLAAQGGGGLGSLIPLRVGDIYQQFSSVSEGVVKNIIEFSAPGVLQKGTAEVRATYSVRTSRRIQLAFQEAGVRGIHIAPALEALLAPALLPRTWLNHRALLALAEAEAFVPLRRSALVHVPRVVASTEKSLERSFGSEYLLTYLDEDMLVGSQTGTGGTFIFNRAAPA